MSSKAIPSNTAVACYGYNDGSQAPFVTRHRLQPPRQAHRSRRPQGRDNPQAESGFMDMTQTTLHRANSSQDKSIPPVRMISVCPRAAMSSGKENAEDS